MNACGQVTMLVKGRQHQTTLALSTDFVKRYAGAAMPPKMTAMPPINPPMPATIALAQAVAAALDGQAVIDLAQQLVQIDSVAAPARPHEQPVVDFLAGYLQRAGFAPAAIEVALVAPLRPNLRLDWQGSNSDNTGRLLLLEGHSDVVIEGERSAWARDPFGGQLEGGRLWGRGSADMKGGLAAAIVALQTVAAHAPALAGGVRLLVPCDEEGMMRGIRAMVGAGWHLRPDGQPADGAIICEPEELELCLAQRGGIRVQVRVTGIQAHGAMPYAGRNPLPAVAQIVLAALELQAELQASVAPHRHLGLPWVTPTVLAAGSIEQLNVMPGTALVALDIRTVPGIEHAALHHRLKQVVAAAVAPSGCQYSLEVLDDRPWTATAPAAAIVRALEAACSLVLGREASYGGVPGTTDGTFLHQAGVPIVTVGPGNREIPHQSNEWLDLDELVAAARLYAATIVLFLSEPASQ
jgi:succinyl-diaminopimelate desuccinylase